MPDHHPNIPEGRFLVFLLDRHKFALPISIVERIVGIAAITPIPRAPEHIKGVINIRGQVIPVFDIRKIFGLPSREVELSDRLILLKAENRRISFAVDSTAGVTDRLNGETVPADQIYKGLGKIVEGLTFFENAMILIYDIGKIMSLENRVRIDLTAKKENPLKAPGGKTAPVRGKKQVSEAVRAKNTGGNRRKK